MHEGRQRVWVSLGSNLGDRAENLRRAVRLTAEAVGALVRCSSHYETEPQGFTSPNRFLNAAAVFDTDLTPLEVLHRTQEVERAMGRTHKSVGCRYADRLIDIDLLCHSAGACSLPDEGLELPHPRAAARLFVLEPLCEIDPLLRLAPGAPPAYELMLRLKGSCVERYERVGEGDLESFNVLLPQLSRSARPLTAESLAALCAHPDTAMLIVRNAEGRPAGMLTLCRTQSPTGTKVWAEDFVVDAACRGRGLGRQLMERAKWETIRMGGKHLNFTSRPTRAAANDLYRGMGFELRDTNVYRFTPQP